MPTTDYNILILKAITGAIAPEENTRLQQWLTESRNNQQVYEEIKVIWEIGSRDEDTNENPDDITQQNYLKQEWLKLEAAAQDSLVKDNQLKQYQRSTRTRWISIGLIILLSSVAAAWPILFPPQPLSVHVYAESKNKITWNNNKIILNKNSTASITKALNKSPELNITGEAFIENASETPLLIHVNNTILSVSGSAFLFKTYANQIQQLIALTHPVQITYQQQEINLHPNDIITLQSGKIIKTKNNNPNLLTWYTGSLCFKNATLQQVLSEIEKHYHIQFETKTNNVLTCHFTGDFHNEDLNTIIKILSYSMNLTFTQNNNTNTFTISGTGCQL